MQQAMTGYQRMVSGARRLLAAVRRGGGVGVLAGLLLLPLGVGAVGSGDLDTSFGGDGTVLTDFGSGSLSDYGLRPGHSVRWQDCGGRLFLELCCQHCLCPGALSAQRHPGYHLQQRWQGDHQLREWQS